MQKTKNMGSEPVMGRAMPASALVRWGGLALILGGLLWIITYIAGIAAGKLIDPDYFDGSLLMWIGMIASEAAHLILSTGLIALGMHLRAHSKWLASAGLVLAVISFIVGLAGLILFPSLLKGAILPRMLAAVVEITLFASATLLSITMLRVRALPRWAALVLLLVGILTVPLIFVAFPLGAVLPNYLVSDLPLALAAVGLVVGGYVALTGWRTPVGQVVESR